jgi:hypothetical protein
MQPGVLPSVFAEVAGFQPCDTSLELDRQLGIRLPSLPNIFKSVAKFQSFVGSGNDDECSGGQARSTRKYGRGDVDSKVFFISRVFALTIRTLLTGREEPALKHKQNQKSSQPYSDPIISRSSRSPRA